MNDFNVSFSDADHKYGSVKLRNMKEIIMFKLAQGWRWVIHCFTFLLLLATVGACGGSGGSSSAVSAEAQAEFGLESITPSPFEGVALSSSEFVITFTKPLNASTVSADTAGIWAGRVVPATIDLISDRQIRIKSTHILTPNATYQLVVTDEVKGANGERFDGLIVNYLIDGFEIYRTDPADKEESFYADSNIKLEFTEPVVIDTLYDNFVLYDVTDGKSIEFTAHTPVAGIVNINPAERLTAGNTIEFRANAGILSHYGATLPPLVQTFTVSEQRLPPKVTDFYPDSDAEFDPLDSIVISFTQDLDPTMIDENDVFIREDSSGKAIATKAVVNGPQITITPVEPLKYKTKYQLARLFAKNSKFQDLEGKNVGGTMNWFFTTKDAAEALPLEISTGSYAVNDDKTHAYFYNSVDPTIARVNLVEFDSATYLTLDKVANSVCVTDSSLYTLTLKNDQSEALDWTLTEYDAYSLAEKMSSTIRLERESINDSIFTELYCAKGRVFINSYAILYEIDIKSSSGNNLSVIREFDTGSVTLKPGDDDILIYASDELFRLDGKDVVKLYDLARSSWTVGGGIAEASIEKNLYASVNAIYQLDTGDFLSAAGKSHLRDVDDYVQAVDFNNMRWFAGQSIYSLQDFSRIGPVHNYSGAWSFFDHHGNLYYSKLRQLYRIDHSIIASGLLGD